MILVDTSVLIGFLRGEENGPCREFERVLRQEIPFGINSLILQEVLQGAASEKEFRLLEDYLGSQHFYPFKDPVGTFAEAARIYMKCRKKGITIRSTVDCLIARNAIEHNLYLLHNDADFVKIAEVVTLRLLP
jgi:predicted nucleic acid-binding protein